MNSVIYANDARDIFFQALNFSKSESPFSHKIDWDNIEKKGLAFIGRETIACRGTSAIANILAPVLSKYDYHTFVTEQGLGSNECPIYQSKKLSRYWNDWIQSAPKTRALIKEKVSSFWGKRFGNIAYIYVPSGFAYSDDALEKQIRKGRMVMDNLNLETATGIIVDLRMNTGGHYFPMLMSISKIINPTTLFKYTNGEGISISEDGNTLLSSTTEGANETLYQITYLPPVHQITIPIVVLVDEGTASSGAITAFALKENSSTTRLLGERTSPTLSVNAGLKLKDGNYFNLMVLKLLSPSGIENNLYLDVDVKIGHDFNSMFGSQDQSINKAIALLKSELP